MEGDIQLDPGEERVKIWCPWLSKAGTMFYFNPLLTRAVEEHVLKSNVHVQSEVTGLVCRPQYHKY